MVCLGAILAPELRAADVLAQGRELRVNDHPFLMRGVCCAPNPVGSRGDQAPNGDYFTPEYRSIYMRDLPLMRDLGINCIRVYGWKTNASHQEFLDLAWNNGDRPVFVLINNWVWDGWDWAWPADVEGVKIQWQTIAAGVSNHPAVLGFLIGNELNTGTWHWDYGIGDWSYYDNSTSAAFWKAMNDVAAAIHQQSPGHLVSTTMKDNNLVSVIPFASPLVTNFNAWCVQMYRGSNFGTFLSDYPALSGKPLLMSEWGFDALDARTGAEFPDNASLQARWLSSLWSSLTNQYPVASGGALFEWCDEWWKIGGVSTHDAGGWANGAFLDGQADEEFWSLHRIGAGTPNTLDPRAAVETFRQLWTPRISNTRMMAGGFQFDVSGPPVNQVIVQTTTNLSDWRATATNTAPFTFTNPVPLSSPAHFYRVVNHQ